MEAIMQLLVSTKKRRKSSKLKWKANITCRMKCKSKWWAHPVLSAIMASICPRNSSLFGDAKIVLLVLIVPSLGQKVPKKLLTQL